MVILRTAISLLVLALFASPLYADNTAVTHSVAAIATTSTTAVAAITGGRTRKMLILINDSDTTIYCNLAGGTAVANQGIRLNASGGSIFMDIAVTFSAVNCIHGGASTKSLLVSEGN